MARTSRVERIGGTTPSRLTGVEFASSGRRAQSAARHVRDPVIATVARWMAAKDAVEAMQLDWASLEHQLILKVGPLKMDIIEQDRSVLPEARAMRTLMRKIKAADRALERAAEGIALMRARSVAGALAKIELGLRIQGPCAWQDHAFGLVQDGVEHLRRLA